MNRIAGTLVLAGAFLAGSIGCDHRGKADIPKQMIELPKEGPVNAGGGPRQPKDVNKEADKKADQGADGKKAPGETPGTKAGDQKGDKEKPK